MHMNEGYVTWGGKSSFELPHDKTNKMACAPSKDSDQPRRPPSLISLRCALNEQLRFQAFFMQTAKTLIRLKAQSDQDLHCLQFPVHILDALLYGKAILFKF